MRFITYFLLTRQSFWVSDFKKNFVNPYQGNALLLWKPDNWFVQTHFKNFAEFAVRFVKWVWPNQTTGVYKSVTLPWYGLKIHFAFMPVERNPNLIKIFNKNLLTISLARVEIYIFKMQLTLVMWSKGHMALRILFN